MRVCAACLLLAAPTPLYYRDYVIESPPGRPRLAQAVAKVLREAPPLPALPSSSPSFGDPIRIILADSDAHFDSLTGGRVPEWGVAVANPAAGIIVLPGYGGGRAINYDMRRVLRHELAHVALHRFLQPAVIPRWFNEGYATWASGELDFEAGWQLRLAFATNRAPPLDSLELSWPSATTDARLAYLLSASVVEYLVRASGERGLALFLQRWRAQGDIEGALAATYGLSLDQLETHWRRDVRSRYGWLAVLAQSAVFMAAAGALVIVLFAIRRRRDRAKLALLKATEPPDAPAYWNEPENRPSDD